MAVQLDDPIIETLARNPAHRGFSQLPAAERVVSAAGENPFCGDELEVRVALVHDELGQWRVAGAAYEGYGCQLCLAGAEVIMGAVVGLTAREASRLSGDDACRLLGGLEVGRTRRGCVDLGARILNRALASVM